MSRILVAGLCPLPFENTLRSYGPGIRTWQFAWSLARAGHEVRVLAMMTPGAYGDDRPALSEDRQGILIDRLTDVAFLEPATIRRAMREFQPQALVGASLYGSAALARAGPRLPFWADQFGSAMAEAQALAAVEGRNWPVAHAWALLAPVLCCADRLSVVSEHQLRAAIGEAGAVGRLTAETSGYELVSTGGAIPGLDAGTYARFCALVARSPHRERFHIEGWVQAKRVASYAAEADVGVLADRSTYEGLLGSRNRIVQWMGAGLPAVCSRVGEIADLLAERELGLTFPAGDADALAERLLWAAGNTEELRTMAARAREYARAELGFEATTRPLTSWAADPRPAPDARSRVRAPRDHATLRQRLAGLGRRVPVARRSEPLVRLWRRLFRPRV